MKDEVKFIVYDNDQRGDDDYLAHAYIKMEIMCENNSGVKEWFTMFYDDDEAGEIFVESRYVSGA